MQICYDRNAFIEFNSFSLRKKKPINIVITQIVTSITSSPSGTGFYVMRWVNMEDGDTEIYHVSSLIQDFVFSSRKMGCIGCIQHRYIIKEHILTL